MPIMPALRRLRHEEHEFETILNYTAKPCLNKTTSTTNRNIKSYRTLTLAKYPIFRKASGRLLAVCNTVMVQDPVNKLLSLRDDQC